MEDLANVWPTGGLFAFSGVDGETCHAEPFVAGGTRDGLGWRFWLKPRLTVMACLGATPLVHRRASIDYCLSDCWRCTTEIDELTGIVEGAFLDAASMAVAIAFSALPEYAVPEIMVDPCGYMKGGVVIVPGEGWWVAVCAQEPELRRQFGIAISYRSEAEAVERALRARDTNMRETLQKRLAHYAAAPVPESVSGNMRRTYYKALAVQKVNVESPQAGTSCRWTTPDRMPHRHMWMWDSAFHAVGLQHVNIDLAHDALRALFLKQQPDGKLPLAVQPDGRVSEDNNTQPPIVAWAVCRLLERSLRPGFAGELYPRLIRYLDWFETNRRNEKGLYGWDVRQDDDPIRGARGGESGMDNSPRFDKLRSMTAVDLSSYLAAEYWNLEKIARVIEKHGDVDEWRNRRSRIADRVNELLWDDEDSFYYDLDEYGDYVPVKTVAGFTPLLGQIPDRDRAEALRMHLMNPNEFWSPFPVASVSQDEVSFSDDMWRGPTWANMNVLIYYGLMAYGFFQEARMLARITVQEIARCYVQHGCLYEFYDCMASKAPAELHRKGGVGEGGGVGFGVVEDLHWTAASFIHLVNEIG